VAAPLLSCALAAAFAWGPAEVVSVTFAPPHAAALADLGRAFGVAPGDPLSRAAIRRGVQALIASRAVEDVTVHVREAPSGAALDVRLQLASRVTEIALAGVPRRERAPVLADLGVREGDLLRVAAFEEGVERARAGLRARGFLDAAIDPGLEFDVARGAVRVSLAVRLGEELTVRSLAATGAAMPEEELWRRTGLDQGERASEARLERARRRLLVSLRRDGFWESDVDAPSVAAGAGGAAVSFAVRLGEHWRLELEGIEHSKALEQEALVFLRGEEPFSEAALDLAVARVQSFLQRRGSLLAQVSGEIGGGDGQRTLRILVREGDRRAIREVRFPGLAAIDAATLRERIGARRGHPWWWGREPIDAASLAADAESLRSTLREEGFADAEVGAPRLLAEDGGVVIELPVAQGERRTVAAIAVGGVPAGIALGELPLAAGGPWSSEREARTRAAVLLALQDAGWADARVEVASECSAGACAVRVAADPGAPVRVGNLVVAGLGRTRPSVVERVARVAPGMPLGPSEQLAVQRRLLGLGVFERAALRPIPGQDAGASRGWVLDLAEAPTGAFGFGLGWDTVERLRLSASWSETNVLGRAGIVAFQGRLSDRQRMVEVSYRETGKVGLIGFPNWTTVYRTEEYYPSFDLLRRGMWVQAGDVQARPWRRLLRYDYQIVDSNAPDEILSELERDQQDVRLTSITPILEWDTRDDVFTPRRGTFASAQLQLAFKWFLGEAEFEKLSVSVARFVPVLGGVAAGSLRGGVIWPRPAVDGPCDVEDSPSGCDNLAVPIAVRYFGGGRISHRAFATDLLGIPGKTLICPAEQPDCLPSEFDPVGGAAIALGSVEWRFPIYGAFGGGVFVDAGNVWASRGDVRAADLRWGAGFGLRVETPVGPIRLEYGWKLDREPGESRGELFLALGNPF
jgi:outer membrane protein insertion porin family